jgi:hypothetical protein
VGTYQRQSSKRDSSSSSDDDAKKEKGKTPNHKEEEEEEESPPKKKEKKRKRERERSLKVLLDLFLTHNYGPITLKKYIARPVSVCLSVCLSCLSVHT